jgi:hypothetical protein
MGDMESWNADCQGGAALALLDGALAFVASLK